MPPIQTIFGEVMSGPYYAVPHCAVPHVLKENIVHTMNDVQISEWQDRLFMFKGDVKVAELVNGRARLKKTYKDSFDVWIDKIKKKDLKKAEKMRADAERIMKDADAIEQLWSR